MGYESTDKITIRGRALGDGILKLCVPLVGRTREELAEEIAAAVLYEPDFLEWRADFFDEVSREGALGDALALVREAAGEIPVLFTLRHPDEGGAAAFLRDEKRRILRQAALSGNIDLADIEMRYGGEFIAELKETFEKGGVKLVLSYHNNRETEPDDEIRRKLLAGERLGADIVKVSMLATDFHAVSRFLHAIREAKRERLIRRPLIATAGGVYGGISRLLGERMGSDLTFVAAGSGSDPGQMHIEDYRAMRALIREGEC